MRDQLKAAEQTVLCKNNSLYRMTSDISSKARDSDPITPKRRVFWPPNLILQTPMGYLRDSSGNDLPRDIGRSSIFKDGTVIFQFGDTFCHSMNGQFIGLSPNNASFCNSSKDPTVSSYFAIQGANGHLNSDQKVPALLKFLPGEGDTETHFLKFWCFSGIVETHTDDKGNRCGVCYYETRELNREAIDDGQYLYTGIAHVIWNREHLFLEARREVFSQGPQFFLADEPRFGAFCAVIDIDLRYIYLYGHTSDNSKSVVLARAPPRRAIHKEYYEYWSGSGWSSKMSDTKPVFATMQHGQIFQTEMFGQDSPWKYAFIGCNSWGDSKAQFGRAMQPQGPWDTHELKGLRTYAMQQYDPSPFRYCFYPHPWAFEMNQSGDLMITWSEGGMRGGVIAELLRFETIS
ncbi:hypothetical protein N431DRAFT_359225 [Stipitochalara longipes BDJ]|nr:hypothetical protein N431DRAFT_359225 [Stipitochalara longipes BDJ]